MFHGPILLLLSSLCSSEQAVQDYAEIVFFLSSLCGSEHTLLTLNGTREFLSCLCGSERAAKYMCDLLAVSKLPVRQ